MLVGGSKGIVALGQKKVRSSKALVAISSVKMALATLISRVLGLVREQLLAFYFGASGVTDAFFVAYRIPNLLRDLFAEGAFSAAFVPVFTKAQVQDGKERALEVFRATFLYLFGITAFLSLVIYWAAPFFIKMFAPSFMEDPLKYDVAINLLRIVAPFICVLSLAALFMGALNSLKVFFLPSVSPALLNLSVIFSLIFLKDFFAKSFGQAIYAVGFGVMLGGVLQMLIQYPFLAKRGFTLRLPKRRYYSEVGQIVGKMGPGVIGFALTQINLLVSTILATGAGVGSVSLLNFAFRLFQLPVGIMSVSLGNSTLVHFSELWQQNRREEAARLVDHGFFLSLLTMVPVGIVTIICPEWLIALIFQHGSFVQADSLLSGKALFYYGLGLPLYGLYKLYVPLFYAIDKQKIPVITSALAIAVNISFGLAFINDFGFSILALGSTLAMLTNTSIQMFFLKKYLDLDLGDYFNLRLARVFLVTVIALGTSFYCKQHINFFSLGLFGKVGAITLVSLVAFTSFYMFLWVLGERQGLKAISRKFFK